MNPRFYYTKMFGRYLLGPRASLSGPGRRRRFFERLTHLHYDSLEGFYSQSGQDRFLDQLIFKGKRNGVFVDIGANDGINLSNSYFFEKNRDWTGLCVEPNPMLTKQIAKTRNCKIAEVAAAKSDGELQFAHYDDSRHVYGRPLSENMGIEGFQTIKVQAREINTLLKEHDLKEIDYLSIDIEGGERALFESIELSYFQITVISLEQNEEAVPMDHSLDRAGYELAAKIGCDRIYTKRGYIKR